MAVKWFAVKTLYRSKARGRPEKPDLRYDPDATLLEERLLLIKAKNTTEAISKAERDAKDYAQKASCTNPYNQEIVTYYIGYYDIFELSVPPADKVEVFSMTRLISQRIPDKRLMHIYIGKRDFKYAKGKKKKFSNRDFISGDQ